MTNGVDDAIDGTVGDGSYKIGSYESMLQTQFGSGIPHLNPSVQHCKGRTNAEKFRWKWV